MATQTTPTSSSATVKPLHRSLAVLKLPRTVPTLITYAGAVIKSMTGNPSLPSPTPPLATVSAAVAALQTAEQSALARTKGAVATRNEQKTVLVGLLEQLKAYVQSVVDANLDNGVSIINGAGMAARKTPAGHPHVLSAKPGPFAGSAKLTAPAAARRASHNWEYSADGGKTWVAMPSTLQSKTSMTGLASGTIVQFRSCPVTKAGQGDWSAPVSLLVP
jgi:hypothetical protein